jgi:hypothetical protein
MDTDPVSSCGTAQTDRARQQATRFSNSPVSRVLLRRLESLVKIIAKETKN